MASRLKSVHELQKFSSVRIYRTFLEHIQWWYFLGNRSQQKTSFCQWPNIWAPSQNCNTTPSILVQPHIHTYINQTIQQTFCILYFNSFFETNKAFRQIPVFSFCNWRPTIWLQSGNRGLANTGNSQHGSREFRHTPVTVIGWFGFLEKVKGVNWFSNRWFSPSASVDKYKQEFILLVIQTLALKPPPNVSFRILASCHLQYLDRISATKFWPN